MKTKNILFTSLILVALLTFQSSFITPNKVDFNKKLKTYCESLANEFSQISEERKKDLIEIGDYVIEQRLAHKTCNLLFICTSNSRRSHMGQIWSQTAATYYGIDSVWTFSGGTEATRVHPNTVAVLKRCGFGVTTTQAGDNPIWFVSSANKMGQWAIFSKKYDHSINPKKNFAAAMVCSEADKSCPIVDGADLRVSLPYEDPKYYDNTPAQDQKYDERCRQVAREMFFMLDYVKQKMILKSESKK
jgi:arsenate reductase